jgi:hypothetical protein
VKGRRKYVTVTKTVKEAQEYQPRDASKRAAFGETELRKLMKKKDV